MPVKISALSAAATLTGTEAVPIVQGGATVKATVAQFAAGAIANGAAGKATANVFTAAQTINLNTAAPPTPVTTTSLQLVGANALSAIATIESFGGAPAFLGRRANGTAAAPTAILAGDILNELPGRGYHGSGYSITKGALRITAQENWSGSAQGTQLQFTTTSIGTTSEVVRWVMAANGDLLPNAGSSYSVGNVSNRALYVYAVVLSTSATTVAGLAGVGSPTAGMRWFVTDSNATKATGDGNVVVGGGSNGVPVYYDGANWRIG